MAARADAPCDAPVTTLLVVRHADRAGQADSLSAAGVARARDLVHVAQTASVRAIYHSDTRRTRDTAAPLAASLGLDLLEYPAKETAPLIERVLEDHAGQTVLIVGHSNTVPTIIAAAGGPVIPDLDEKEFDGLFVVYVTCRDRPSLLLTLQYGAPSPAD
jgi:broad specificity phosphatase PhoE